MISLEKCNILTTLQKLPQNVGKIIVAIGFEKLPKSATNCPIWSHWASQLSNPSTVQISSSA